MSAAPYQDLPGESCPFAETRDRFIDRMGDHLEAEGLPRIAGRIFGLMILAPDPVSFGDLALRLGVSRASISTNARLVEAMGLIERISIPGERQDFFRLSDAPYVRMMSGIVDRMRTTLVSIATTYAGLPHEAVRERARLEEACRFFDAAIASLTELTVQLSDLKDEARNVG